MRTLRLSLTFWLSLAAASFAAGPEDPSRSSPADVLKVMKRVADWQLTQPPVHAIDDWTYGALYAGMMALSGVADSPKYHDAMLEVGRKANWNPGKRIYHGDDHCVSQMYLELYWQHRDPAMLQPTRERFDYILSHQATNQLTFRVKGSQDRWSWCDALFMSPPAWLRLYLSTGDRRYLDFMDREWKFTSDYLYDKEEHLYFRDSTYFEKREANGKKIFWSRGNGWVMAGLARVLQVLPPEHTTRPFYLQQFKEMAAKIAALQQPDGLWRSSLLDPGSYPLKETSGSGFYTFALAWGLNRGILDSHTYEPVVYNAWRALVHCVNEQGKLEHVQPIGADPKNFDPTHSDVYGVGALLLAGSEMFRLALARAPSMAYANFMPQRKDDLAWENDRIAFRIYGPALERTGEISSGIDVWAKQTRKPVVERWYFVADYHKDHGEGLDFYKVGPSRGCGGTAVWSEGKIFAANNFVTWRILENGPARASFEVGYAPYRVRDLVVRETRRFALDAGSNLSQIQTRLEWEGGPDELEVAVGIVKRDGGGKLETAQNGSWMSYWEPEQPGGNGTLGCAVVLPDGARLHDTKDQALLVSKLRRNSTLSYYAGAGWTKSGGFPDQTAWNRYVAAFASRLIR